MSDILIKGMDIPQCCADCPLNDEYDDCGALDTDYYTEGKYTGRLPNCPLVEVPDMPTQTLGDLFNAMGDAFKKFANNIKQKEDTE